MIVLDTHALIWWVGKDARLSASASQTIERELSSDGSILISAISAWEIAMLLQRNRLSLAMDLQEWLGAVESIEGVELIPINARVALQAAQLPGEFHKDPADRFIVALARERNVLLLTADEKIQRYPHVRSVW